MRYKNEIGSKWKDFVPPLPLGEEASLPPEIDGYVLVHNP